MNKTTSLPTKNVANLQKVGYLLPLLDLIPLPRQKRHYNSRAGIIDVVVSTKSGNWGREVGWGRG